MQKIVVITGATGTLGSRLMTYHVSQGDIVFALSRCDHKISIWEKSFPKVNWCLGDIRNDLHAVLPNIAHIVYHCAALKHVDKGEIYPNQYHAVNYEGTLNVFHHINAEKFVYFSTDKAVLPVNFYGMSKALAEKHLLSIKRATGKDIRIFRWGNIIGSQGSAIHGFMKQIEHGMVNVTHPDMTRFWLKIDDAVQFATIDELDRNADVLIHPKIKAAKVTDLIKAIAWCMGEKYETKITGIRLGEKIHEHLLSDHEICVRSDTAEKYTHDELLGLVGPTVSNYLSKKVQI
jgi:UDP-N-acetylglucosamine 4,6-dehydratase